MSRAFLFDIGNVLVHFDFEPAVRRLVQLSEATPDEVKSRLLPIKVDHESGRLSDEDFMTQAIGRIGFRGTRAEFAEIWSDIFTENAPMTALVETLAGRHSLYLFSNTSGLHKDLLFAKFNVFALFDGGVYSHEAGCLKPHEEIYRSALEQFGLDPARTFYVDDLAENIATGDRLGFVTHHYGAEQHPILESGITKWLSGTKD